MPMFFMLIVPVLLLGGTGLFILIETLQDERGIYLVYAFPLIGVISAGSFMIGLIILIIQSITSSKSANTEPTTLTNDTINSGSNKSYNPYDDNCLDYDSSSSDD